MDSGNSDPFEGHFHVPESDSGSAYENSGSDFEQESHDESASPGPAQQDGRDEELSEGGNDSFPTSFANPGPDTPYTDEWIRADAIRWAATFLPPNVEDIPIPERNSDPRPGPGKRKLLRSNGSLARAKRVKGFYSNDYRNLLNIEIHDAGKRSIHEDNIPLQGSQIGSSMWTAEEKDSFFTGLSRMGRDNVRAIATRVGTKSEVEVQEYMQVLHEALIEKKNNDARLLEATEIPAALQITPECCDILERAADCITARQEQYEEQVEEAKWGEHWLLTEDVSKILERKLITRRGQGATQDVFPAINLLNLRNWLVLSQRVFMNPSEPNENNWRQIGEKGETPAIRATAFEDFHSLTVSITKRLMSTVLFCTMSRMRAMDSKRVKAAEINSNDVEAAAKILKMDANDDEFWIKCARRNNLAVYDEDIPDNDTIMTYEDVEKELRKEYRRSKSRSRSRPIHHTDIDHSEPDSEVYISDVDSLLDSDLEHISSESTSDSENFSDNPFTQPSASQNRPQGEHLSTKAYEAALETHISAFDARASMDEEARMWRLLRQEPPFAIKNEEDDELPEKPLKRKMEPGDGEGTEWRGREFWSEWEAVGLVTEEEFRRNRVKMGRRERSERNVEGAGLRSEEYVVDSESDGNGADELPRNGDMENDREPDEDHDKESSQNPPKHRSYAVYNSDD